MNGDGVIMNPLLREALASILRWIFNIAAGYLVALGIWEQGDSDKYVMAAAIACVTLIWGIWQKYHIRQKLVTALASPAPQSEQSVETVIKAGVKAHVSTPKSIQPFLKIHPDSPAAEVDKMNQKEDASNSSKQTH
jgi:hypothetical protein